MIPTSWSKRFKVLNESLYEKLPTDIRPDLYNQLIDYWKYAVENDFISPVEAKNIVGITEVGNKSTASRFKYGRTYYV